MWIDCQSCPVAATHCDGCMVAGLLDLIPATRAEVEVALDARERAVVTALASAGLISAETAATARARPAPQRLRSATG